MAHGLCAAQPSPLCTIPCPVPSWRQLCPTEQHSPALGTHPSLTTTKRQCMMGTVWSENRIQEGHSAVLTHVVGEKFMHFDTSDKHSPASSKKKKEKRKKKAAVFFILIKEFEKRFQDCRNKYFFLYICASVFIQHKYSNIFQMECIKFEIRYSTQRKIFIMSLY